MALSLSLLTPLGNSSFSLATASLTRAATTTVLDCACRVMRTPTPGSPSTRAVVDECLWHNNVLAYVLRPDDDFGLRHR